MKDTDNQDLWNEISETFQSTLDMLCEMAKESGVDIDESALKEEIERENSEREKASDNELVKSAEQYMETVFTWFDSSEDLFRIKQEELNLHARIELPGSDPEAQAADLNDIVEIIQWYHTLIPAKIHRAFYQLPIDFPVDYDELPSDADGSAKVALISIDRSIAAWMSMRNHFPEKEGEILDILIHLDCLRKSLEKAFPKARIFKRPGFDD